MIMSRSTDTIQDTNREEGSLMNTITEKKELPNTTLAYDGVSVVVLGTFPMVTTKTMEVR